jgi:hypothetical protein
MKRNEPHLRQMFSEWQLPEDQVRKVLETIHQREDMRFDAVLESWQNSARDQGDRSDPAKVKARTEKTLGNVKAAEFFAESILLPMLGPERFALLKELEAKVDKHHRQSRPNEN